MYYVVVDVHVDFITIMNKKNQIIKFYINKLFYYSITLKVTRCWFYLFFKYIFCVAYYKLD